MSKLKKIQHLYTEIFGQKVNQLDFERYYHQTISGKKTNYVVDDKNDKCSICNTYQDCVSFSKKQDLPFFKDIEKVDTMIIAEAPGKGDDKGVLGHVFGWNEYLNLGNQSLKLAKYHNYFTKFLNLNEEQIYVTDSVKCYTKKEDLASAFSKCSNYLKREIDIINPKRIIFVSKKGYVDKFIKENKLSSCETIPHPSGQNFSKVPTVIEIFEKFIEHNNLTHYNQTIKEMNNLYEEINKSLYN